jgi:NADPH:quinone reductase-like Zn-dependent oxidoreductase
MGSTLRSRTVEYQADLIQKFKEQVLPKLSGKNEENDLRVVIYKVYKFEEIVQAHKDLEGNDTIGKLIVTID